MTTIVGVKDRLVSDSKIIMEKTNGDDTQYEGPKLYRKGDAIIGTAGSHGLGEAFIKWYGSKKAKPKFPPKADFEALVLTEKGLYHFDEDLSGGKVDREWFAIGSGSFAALGALHAGKTPEEAVLIACKVDPYSGEPVQVLKLETT
jgi:hypothetical protein